ncbi:hypothetical protein [Chryseobacterium sp.]|uniref:hypothetical protein n=1 Tax=Chryseobacterium sp. TaxID=1871047 RepID=UPI00321A6FF5
MKSTIRVDFDFDTNEPFIQLGLSVPKPAHYMVDVEAPNIDLADKTLRSFLEQANNRGMELVYPKGNQDNTAPQIRLKDNIVKSDETEILIRQLDLFAKQCFKEADYKKWEYIYNLFVNKGKLWSE